MASGRCRRSRHLYCKQTEGDKPMHSKLRALIAALVIGIAPTARAADVEQTNVKLILDWVYDGAHAFILLTDAKGYFKQEGLNVQIDAGTGSGVAVQRSEEHTSELQSQFHLVCRLLLEKKKKKYTISRFA